MTRLACVVLALTAGPLAAQDSEAPKVDPQVLESCLAAAEGKSGKEACIGIASNRCQDEKGGASTPNITGCLLQETALWDAKLNDAYSELMSGARRMDSQTDTTGSGSPSSDVAGSLKQMQLEWIEFRDAACSYAYDRYGGGSMRNIAGAACRMETTAKQALTLQGYLDEYS